MDRRDFVKTAGLAPFVGEVRGANDRIVVGQIGLGGRGKYELSVCLRNAGVRIAAVCDVYRPLVDGAVSMLGGKVDGYQDFRRILERKDIDAVFVSTPDHWHAIAAIMACQAGKDVYCEKPLTHTILEGRRMVEAARKYNRVVQTGSQQRSAEHYAKVVELIRGGYIGKVSFVECWNVINSVPDGMGNPPDADPPEGLDWDMYLGPAPMRRYNRNRFIYNFRWFWDYGCGMMTDWGAHHFDIIHWAMNVDAPLTAACAGGKYCLEDNSETPDAFAMDLEYPRLHGALHGALHQRPRARRAPVRHRVLRNQGHPGSGPRQLGSHPGDGAAPIRYRPRAREPRDTAIVDAGRTSAPPRRRARVPRLPAQRRRCCASR